MQEETMKKIWLKVLKVILKHFLVTKMAGCQLDPLKMGNQVNIGRFH